MNIEEKIKKGRFLITGGAGFIGSNIVKFLIERNASNVIVIDNLSNGNIENINQFSRHNNFKFIEGDIRDKDLIENVMKDVDYISHQAALGSVPRSIKDPITSNSVNSNGFLNILNALTKYSNVNLVYASSSSVYGDTISSPKVEGQEGEILSPYAVTKKNNEDYAYVFGKIWGLKITGLRYFNVFGPNQQPDNPYAAVIPLFCKAMINDNSPIINGDSNITRDFTYVENVIQANIKALFNNKSKNHKVYNVGCGESISLMNIVDELNKILKKKIKPKVGPYRPGDILHSLASIKNIQKDLNYKPEIYFSEGLRLTMNWMLINNGK
tara:strand:+ start:3279 stop:4256 length:978 start_codon:yes stop_codon:yes gene_type:complete